MKEIYVIKETFGHGYKATSMEEIEELAKESTLISVTIQTENPSVTIHLYRELLFACFGIPEGAGEELAKDYLSYVAEITGCDIPEI